MGEQWGLGVTWQSRAPQRGWMEGADPERDNWERRVWGLFGDGGRGGGETRRMGEVKKKNHPN